MTTLHTGRARVTAADLQRYQGKPIIVNYYDDPTDEPKLFEGKVKGVSEAGVALANRNTSLIIEIAEIIDFEPVVRQRRVIRRHLRVLTDSDLSVRQHLADRHGLMVDLLNAVDEETARTMHDRIDHKPLGHDHVTREDRERMMSTLGEDADADDEDDD